MSQIQISCRNFRKLQNFKWNPSGVSLIVGPNGSGKTTVLDMLRFLRETFMRSHENGFEAAGGGDHFPTRGLEKGEFVEFELLVNDIRWCLRLPMSDAGIMGHFGEELYRGDELVLKAGVYAETWQLGQETKTYDDLRCCTRVLMDSGDAPWLEPLKDALSDLRTYDFSLDAVRKGTTQEDVKSALHGTGKNLWGVLANWKQAPLRNRGQFEWVMQQARLAFPDLIQTVEFDRNEAFIFPPGATDPADGLPPRRQADGLLVGLLQLTAIAGAREGSIVGLDEMENQLHPHAIRVLIKAMRERAEEKRLTVILTTHSPVLMNEFRGRGLDDFYILEQSNTVMPQRLSEAYAPEWLAQFLPGDLYENLKVAKPKGLG